MSKKTSAKKTARKVAKKKTPAKVKSPDTVEKKTMLVDDQCNSCRFSKAYSDRKVTCRRFPSAPGVAGQSAMPVDGWCGEFLKAE